MAPFNMLQMSAENVHVACIPEVYFREPTPLKNVFGPVQYFENTFCSPPGTVDLLLPVFSVAGRGKMQKYKSASASK
jgi:hypothetical protein